jgi:hypothetical protein
VSGGLLATLSEQAASACRPESLTASTIKAVTSVAAGPAASTGVISAQVAALTEGMVKTMMLSKIKITTGLLLALTVSTAGGWLYTTRADDPPRVEQRKEQEVRAAGLNALEQFRKSEQAGDIEGEIEELVKLRKVLEATESATRTRRAYVEDRLRQFRERRLASAAHDLADLFMFKVPIELGATEFHEGGRIDIVEVRGTRPEIEVGGQYLVRGKYKLPPGQRGKIYFYATAGGAWGAIGTTLDLQSTAVDKQDGEFTLVHGMLGEGHFHLVLADPERYSRMFANVYFGTGKNVLRKKTW